MLRAECASRQCLRGHIVSSVVFRNALLFFCIERIRIGKEEVDANLY